MTGFHIKTIQDSKMFSSSFQVEKVPELLDRDLDFFRRRILEIAGIELPQSKKGFVQARLLDRIRKLGLANFSEYKVFLEIQQNGHPEWQAFINSLTTNKTEWFRERKHFQFIENELIDHWRQQEKKKISVWCAACSTGEEAYSLALVLSKLSNYQIEFEIMASDLDTNVLNKAKNGVYPKACVENEVPDPYLRIGFGVGTNGLEEWMRVRNSIRKTVSFRQINLARLGDTKYFDSEVKFDLIVCRNVFIYFAPPTIQQIVNSFRDVSTKDTYLITGHTESIQKITNSWSLVRPSVYKIK